ncbi:MAG: alkaline phosphatase family protein [Pseudomonadota bacterium]
MKTRVLVIVFDALRPEFVTPDLMPNLHGFAASGCWFDNHHSVFPTETRVNQSAVVTGCYPQRHGVVANRFPIPAVPGQVVSTADDEALEAMLSRLGEPLLGRPTLGALLAANGGRLATISAGTPGGGRLINIDAAETGGLRFALHRPVAAEPAGVANRITDKIGPVPPYMRPAVDWNRYAVDAWLDVIDPENRPDVTLLWLCEPDESFHWHGIGSPESLTAIEGVDAAFGEILTRKSDEIASGELQVIAMSDHGQATLTGGKVQIDKRMQDAGFRAATDPGDGVDYTVAVHSAGGIWVRDSDPALTASAVQWLESQDWCGPVFTRDGISGTLTHADLMADHIRAPDIYLALAEWDGANAWGIDGQTSDNAPYPDGNGCHGGLTRHELHNVLAMGGTAFKQGKRFNAPSGNVDILPTLAHLLGIGCGDVDGRVLTEAFPGGAEPDFSTGKLNGGRTRLRRSTCDGTVYLDRGWVG